jgi:hypothetical protein
MGRPRTLVETIDQDRANRIAVQVQGFEQRIQSLNHLLGAEGQLSSSETIESLRENVVTISRDISEGSLPIPEQIRLLGELNRVALPIRNLR